MHPIMRRLTSKQAADASTAVAILVQAVRVLLFAAGLTEGGKTGIAAARPIMPAAVGGGCRCHDRARHQQPELR